MSFLVLWLFIELDQRGSWLGIQEMKESEFKLCVPRAIPQLRFPEFQKLPPLPFRFLCCFSGFFILQPDLQIDPLLSPSQIIIIHLCHFFSCCSYNKNLVQLYSVPCMPAKSLQLCPTLCNPINCSPPGSSVHGILQQEYRMGCHALLQD